MRHDDPMEKIEVELFTPGGNNAVVRMPGRRFPGVLVQGDTLSTLWASAAGARELLGVPETRAEGSDQLDMLVDHLDEILTWYEQALDAHGIKRPYNLVSRA